MTKFERKKFSEYYGSKKYCDGWERIFGNKNKDKMEDESTEHYNACNTNFDGSCDCGLIEQADPEAKEKCSNCHFSTNQSLYPDKLMCAYIGTSCPKDYCCQNYKIKKE
jgi:hypothetical protein